MDAVVAIIGFVLGYITVWYLFGRDKTKKPAVPDKPNVHLVVAGNFSQCRYWADRNFDARERMHVRYLARARDIQGYHGNTVHLHFIGTYYERPDYNDIRDYTVPYAKDHGIVLPDNI